MREQVDLNLHAARLIQNEIENLTQIEANQGNEVLKLAGALDVLNLLTQDLQKALQGFSEAERPGALATFERVIKPLQVRVFNHQQQVLGAQLALRQLVEQYKAKVRDHEARARGLDVQVSRAEELEQRKQASVSGEISAKGTEKKTPAKKALEQGSAKKVAKKVAKNSKPAKD